LLIPYEIGATEMKIVKRLNFQKKESSLILNEMEAFPFSIGGK
jgi:hypothetical protein